MADSVEYLLEILMPNKVVGVRILFTDPNKSHISLHVLTFLSKTCLEKIKVGYWLLNKLFYVLLQNGCLCLWLLGKFSFLFDRFFIL